MNAKAAQFQSRTINHPNVSVYQSTGESTVTLGFEMPLLAPGAALGSVFVRLSEREIADLRLKLYNLGLRP